MKPPSKPCTRCLTPKPLTAFPRQAEKSDGRGTICKDCKNAERGKKKGSEEEYSKQFFTF